MELTKQLCCVSVYIQADKGEFAADALNAGVMKILVASPSW